MSLYARFDAKLMLEKLWNKKLAFVGDSIRRNQWEPLLCMLASAVPNKDSIYEVNGSPISKHNGFLVFKFVDYNCKVEYYWAPFLVLQGRPPAKSPPKVRLTLKLDVVDWSSLKWRNANILVFNTGHWWNYEKTIRGGCYFQEGTKVKLEIQINTAYRKYLETVVDYINRKVTTSKTLVFFRTYAPVHFRQYNYAMSCRTLNGAVEKMYTEMASCHRIRHHCIQIIKTATIPAKVCKRESTKQLHNSKIKFPLVFKKVRPIVSS